MLVPLINNFTFGNLAWGNNIKGRKSFVPKDVNHIKLFVVVENLETV